MLTRGHWAALAVSLLAIGLTGCSAPQSKRLLADTAPGPERAVELRSVPFVASDDKLCGPSTLAMILEHLGREADVPSLTREVYLPGREGALQVEMLAALRARDLLPYRLQPELRVLIAEIRAGNPVLVLQNLGLSWYPRWHYALAVGFDLDRRVIILRSGELARRETGLSAFENTWARSGYWAVVAAEPDRVPVSADWLDWLRGGRDLQQVGQTQAARTAFKAAVRRWPEQPPVLMAAANAELAVGEFAAAEYLLRMAVELTPDNAAAWNNLAHTLNRRACRKAARRAANCAVLLAPEEAIYRQTLREAEQAKDFGDCAPLHCPVL